MPSRRLTIVRIWLAKKVLNLIVKKEVNVLSLYNRKIHIDRQFAKEKTWEYLLLQNIM